MKRTMIVGLIALLNYSEARNLQHSNTLARQASTTNRMLDGHNERETFSLKEILEMVTPEQRAAIESFVANSSENEQNALLKGSDNFTFEDWLNLLLEINESNTAEVKEVDQSQDKADEGDEDLENKNDESDQLSQEQQEEGDLGEFKAPENET